MNDTKGSDFCQTEVVDALLSDEIDAISLKRIISDTLTFDTPLVHLHDRVYGLELFHGPTLAFKDVGARFMARCMSYFNQSEKKEIHILVATSGDSECRVARLARNRPGSFRVGWLGYQLRGCRTARHHNWQCRDARRTEKP